LSIFNFYRFGGLCTTPVVPVPGLPKQLAGRFPAQQGRSYRWRAIGAARQVLKKLLVFQVILAIINLLGLFEETSPTLVSGNKII